MTVVMVVGHAWRHAAMGFTRK